MPESDDEDTQSSGIDEAYEDRNLLALAYIKQAHEKKSLCQRATQIEFKGDYGWKEAPDEDDSWVIVWAVTQEGQISYHVPRELIEDLEWLPEKDIDWDGHTREEKNDRLRSIIQDPIE